MPHALRIQHPASSRSGFTMIEIAISLAVIGFALVAIIAILPLGMSVQKENRQETIINQDANVWMNAIRNGEHGLDDLTNYVTAITNYITLYNTNGIPRPYTKYYWYTYTGSSIPSFGLTNGLRIIGLLSTPKYTPFPGDPTHSFISNHVVAYVRSMSGPASEKPPQNNEIVQGLALSYKLIAEVSPYGRNFFDPSWTNYNPNIIGNNTNLMVARYNYMLFVTNLQVNLHDLRLNFRYPILPRGTNEPGRQIFRTMVSGALTATNEPGFGYPACTLFFFQPRTYVKAP